MYLELNSPLAMHVVLHLGLQALAMSLVMIELIDIANVNASEWLNSFKLT